MMSWKGCCQGPFCCPWSYSSQGLCWYPRLLSPSRAVLIPVSCASFSVSVWVHDLHCHWAPTRVTWAMLLPEPSWSELSGLPLGSKMLTRSNCWVSLISGTMSQQHPGSVLKSVAPVASRANREAWELGQSLRHGLSLKATAQQRPYRYGWTAATQGHGIIPA